MSLSIAITIDGEDTMSLYGLSGPATSTDNAIPRFDGTDGSQIQNSGVTIDDSDNIQCATGVTVKMGGGAHFRVTDSNGTKRIEAQNGGNASLLSGDGLNRIWTDNEGQITLDAKVAKTAIISVDGTTEVTVAAGQVTVANALQIDGDVGFYGTTPVSKQAITGALGSVVGPNAKAVLTSIIAALVAVGLVTDSTT